MRPATHAHARRRWSKHAELRMLDAGIVCLCLLFVAYLYLFYISIFHPRHTQVRTNEAAQPLYTFREDFFEPKVFEGMKNSIVNSRLATARNALNPENFGKTSGAVISFTLKGEKRVRNSKKLQEVLRFFDAVRIEGTNAYVINVLHASGQQPGGAGGHRQWKWGWWSGGGGAHQVDAAAGEHLDDTLPVLELPWLRTTFVSFQTTVLYLQTPADMQGGHLIIKSNGQSLSISPRENAVLAFRGDSPHYVEHFTSPSNTPRVSLVVEQYKIPEQYMHKVRSLYSSVRL